MLVSFGVLVSTGRQSSKKSFKEINALESLKEELANKTWIASLNQQLSFE